MSFKEFNAHPKGLKTGDCVVRAVTTAFGTDYLETRRKLNHARSDRGFTSYKDTKFIYDFLQGYERILFKAQKGKPRTKGTDFCKLYPVGKYIVKMAGHITCCIDGVIHDTWDCSYRTVYTAWKIE